MIRTAASRTASKITGRNAIAGLRSTQLAPASVAGKAVLTSTRNLASFTGTSAFQFRSVTPEPLPALAYDYEDPYEYETDDETDTPQDSSLSADLLRSRSAGNSKFLSSGFIASTSTSGRGPPSSTGNPYPPPSSVESSTSLPHRKGGSGGSRHRCPKCGTSVTFRHGDFEENTFYCATCSGWFVTNPNTFAGADGTPMKSDGSPYEEFLAKNGEGGKKSIDHQILMRHVSFPYFVAMQGHLDFASLVDPVLSLPFLF